MSNKTGGWYYLHKNKDLIYKAGADAIVDIRDSDLCLSAWSLDVAHRADAWNILVEALSLGAKKERIDELAKKWECDDVDAEHYAKYLGIELGEDGNSKTAKRTDFIDLMENQCGFGDTYLEAMADLCKQLGFKGGKLGWHKTFKKLIEENK